MYRPFPLLLANPISNPNPGRSAALAGAVVGMTVGYIASRNALGVILGTASGMILAPLLTGTPPGDLGKALFGRAE